MSGDVENLKYKNYIEIMMITDRLSDIFKVDMPLNEERKDIIYSRNN